MGWRDKDELELRAPQALPGHRPIDWKLIVKLFLYKSDFSSWTNTQSYFTNKNPTPRIALSFGWLVGSSVGDKISAKFQRTISRQRKELPEIRWCQNDRIFEGFLDFPKKYEILDFWISGFLDFWISGFFGISGYISATERATGNPLVSNRPDFRGHFGFSKII